MVSIASFSYLPCFFFVKFQFAFHETQGPKCNNGQICPFTKHKIEDIDQEDRLSIPQIDGTMIMIDASALFGWLKVKLGEGENIVNYKIPHTVIHLTQKLWVDYL
jgi:hypothetical protein